MYEERSAVIKWLLAVPVSLLAIWVLHFIESQLVGPNYMKTCSHLWSVSFYGNRVGVFMQTDDSFVFFQLAVCYR